MAKKKNWRDEDILWQMLISELKMPEVQELQAYLGGEGDHFEMGWGELTIEPYDSHGSSSKIFRIRHERLGETTVGRSALISILMDLKHHFLR